ncbi:MAG: hypothetical protein Q8R70_09125, partial [Methanoregula sp.]|nr:hypothetical protein [Methanoregula sp.]
RGTFREIKKAELISSILEEIELQKFSGICSISSGPVTGTLVFKSGKCILAKILNKSGDGAWEELQKMSSHEVDAALSSLDEAQVQLALEFNKPCRIIKAGKTAPLATSQPQKPAPAAGHEPPSKHESPPRTATAPVKPAAAPVKPAPLASLTPRPSSSFTAPPAQASSGRGAPPSPPARAAPLFQPAAPAKPAAQPPAQPLAVQKPATPAYAAPQIPVHHPQEPKKPAEEEEPPQDSSSFEKDIDTFDTLDLDNVTDKIRNDCKTMIKQLQLEHLMER